ncbi:MAG TPA: hypothetical protein VM599_10680 [Thermoanaerobaculia bacterium]|nr:hypothetical protein [Thermoanaerobaculia bacterium]
MDRELAGIVQANAQLGQLSAQLKKELGSDRATVRCRELAWIAPDGESHCSGGLDVPTPSDLGFAVPPQGVCIGPSTCEPVIHACNLGDGHFECYLTCSPWDGCCIGSCNADE